ncbi:hypothetical protein Tco_0747134 [Tanacetum coccineum]
MSNSNINLQTQSSNALHNAIMEAGSKDRPPMLAPGNYVQWKSRIKRYIDTKPNSELIHYCLQNPPYTYQWAEKTVPVAEGHRFSPNKTSAMYEKTSPRSDLRWKPTGRSLKSVGLRWIPTGKLFDSCTSKVDSEPPHGSNVDILNIHECKQPLDVSAGTSINVQKEQSLDLSAEGHQAAETVTTSNEPDLLFGPLFDKYFNGENQVVLKSSAVTTTDASNKRQQQPDSTSSTSTLATTVTANGNFNL